LLWKLTRRGEKKVQHLFVAASLRSPFIIRLAKGSCVAVTICGVGIRKMLKRHVMDYHMASGERVNYQAPPDA
jgi:hypothetical protein